MSVKDERSLSIPLREIKHYGVLGMKWGRRKNPDGSYDSSTPAGRKGSATNTLKNVKSISDADLRRKLNRLEMEKKLRDMSADEIKRSKTTFDKLKDAAKDVAIKTISDYAKEQLKKAILEQASKKKKK